MEALLENYRAACPSASGYIFENSLGNPLDLNALSRDVIRPVLAKHGLEWKSIMREGAELKRK